MLERAEMVIIAFFVLLAVILVIRLTLPYWRRYEPTSGRVLKRNEQGDLLAIGGREPDAPLQFSGTGTWNSKPIRLTAGSYRLSYHFPANVPVRIGLLSSLDGEDATLLIKSGSGVEGFELEAASYVIQVQPADESADWQIDLQPLKRLPRQP